MRLTDAGAIQVRENVGYRAMEQLRSSGKRTISEAVLRHSTFNVMEDVVRGLIVEMDTYVLADRIADETITSDVFYREWASWWQHTKAVHFPTLSRWLRRPPRQVQRRLTHTFRVRQWVSFPEAQILYPENFGKPVMVEMVDIERSDDDRP